MQGDFRVKMQRHSKSVGNAEEEEKQQKIKSEKRMFQGTFITVFSMPTLIFVRVVCFQKKKRKINLLHLFNSLGAEASEGIGRDCLYVDVILQVTKQHKKKHDK